MVSNRGPMVYEATALPTEPQPLPKPKKCWNVWSVTYLTKKVYVLRTSLSLYLQPSEART